MDAYKKVEADSKFVAKNGDTITGPIEISANTFSPLAFSGRFSNLNHNPESEELQDLLNVKDAAQRRMFFVRGTNKTSGVYTIEFLTANRANLPIPFLSLNFTKSTNAWILELPQTLDANLGNRSIVNAGWVRALVNANTYTLPEASANRLGGVKVGTNLSISGGVLSATDTKYELATTSENGLLRKLSGDANDILTGTGVWFDRTWKQAFAGNFNIVGGTICTLPSTWKEAMILVDDGRGYSTATKQMLDGVTVPDTYSQVVHVFNQGYLTNHSVTGGGNDGGSIAVKNNKVYYADYIDTNDEFVTNVYWR